MEAPDLVELAGVFNHVHATVERYLGIRLRPGHADLGTGIGQLFARIGDDVARGGTSPDRLQALAIEVTVLDQFKKDIGRVHRRAPQMIPSIRRRLRADVAGYPGVRFEVTVAASLIKGRTGFVAGEAPDFRLTFPYDRVGVECTSVTITSESRRGVRTDLGYKVLAAVRRKSTKPYASRSLAVFVDATDVHHASAVGADHFLDLEFLRQLDAAVDASTVGAALVFTHTTKDFDGRPGLGRVYVRSDATQIDPMLLRFLDDRYPHGVLRRFRAGVPRQY